MHPLYPKASLLTQTIIAGAIEVHRDKGPGLVEPIYEWCLLRELELRRLAAANQKQIRIIYKGFVRDEPLRFDVLVEECVLIEVLGLLINFNCGKLTDGLSRLTLRGADV